MKTSTVVGMRLVMDHILPLALTERRRHPQTPSGRMADEGEHRLEMTTHTRSDGPAGLPVTRFMYFHLRTGEADVSFDIGGCQAVCSTIADSLNEFDECRQFAAVCGCDLSEVQSGAEEATKIYILRILDPDVRVLTATPLELLTDHYLPLFVAEFRIRSAVRPSANPFLVEIHTNDDSCLCDTEGECGCDASMSDIMSMPGEEHDDDASTTSSRLVKAIHDALLTDTPGSSRALLQRGYELSVDDDTTCCIRYRPYLTERSLFQEGSRFPARFVLSLQGNRLTPTDDNNAASRLHDTGGWRRITLAPPE